MHERRFNRAIERLHDPERIARLEVGWAAALALENLKEPKSALDVGTGSGLFAEQFAAHGLVVTGLDANPEMLPAAQQYVPAGTFHEGIAEKLPFPDGAFDLVFMGLLLHETDDPLAALKEAHRVARQRLAVLEWPDEVQSFGPPREDRLGYATIESLSRQAGFKEVQQVRLENLVLYRMDKSRKDVKSGYAPVNGLKLYYEIHGAGKPLVLLHGGVGASEMFDPILPALGEKRQVIAVHLQGHGRTGDIDRPFRFESMAEDMAGLMKELDIKKADILGYSLGGGVALQTTIRHPDLVGKLVLISTPCQRHGFYPEVLENMAQMGPEAARFMDQSPLYRLYPEADWPVLFGKLGDLLRQDYDWSQEVAAIKSPVMLICADADAVRPAHALEFFALLGGGQRDAGLDGSGKPTSRLAILPGMTHYDILTFPGLAAMVTSFLDAPM